jgi:hypothetical protein
MGVLAVIGVLAMPAAAQATTVDAFVAGPYSMFIVHGGLPAAVSDSLLPVDVLIEPSGAGRVRVAERSGALLLGVQGLKSPSIACSYVRLLREATCPGGDSGSLDGSPLRDQFDVRGVRALYANLGGGADSLSIRGSGPPEPGPWYTGATLIGINGEGGDDAITLERGSIVGGAGSDDLSTSGGGDVIVYGTDLGDRVDVLDGESGDRVECDTPPSVLQYDAGDVLDGSCWGRP